MKNKFMRIAAVTLMLCLVTTCAISGTFAKYTTEATGSDDARVAYWGFTGVDSDIALNDLFKDSYSTDVKSSVDVIAPGTTNSANFQFKYTAKTNGTTAKTPEVAYQITVSTEGSDCAEAIKKNPNIIWKLDETTFATTTEDGTTTYAFDKLLAAIEALAGNVTNSVAATDGVANYGPSVTYLPDITEEHTITWEWVFETVDDATTTDSNEMDVQDQMDTAMGNTNADVPVEIVITVNATQTNA